MNENPTPFIVFPNPSKKNIKIIFNQVDGQVNLRLININGKLIFKEQKVVTLNNNDVVINVESLSKGVYFVFADGANFRYSKKLLIE